MRPAVALRSPFARVLLAVGSATVAFILTRALDLEQLPTLLPMAAVLVTALYGGFTAGLLSGVLTVVYIAYAALDPASEFHWPSVTSAYRLAVFAVVASAISLLVSRQRRAEATLQATLTSIGDGVIVTDPNGQVTFMNGVAEQLTGWSAKLANGKRANEVFKIVSEETGQPLPNPVDQVLQQNRPARVTQPALLLARDGAERPIADGAAPVRDTHGDRLGAVLVFSDASQQRAAERALREQAAERELLLQREQAARKEAERANGLKDEFLATLSHELRTPLNAVLGWVHMLLGPRLDEEHRARAIEVIHRNALAQARLVDDILDLSRIVTGRMTIDSRPVDLCEIVRSAADAVTPAVVAKHQQLQLELPDDAMVLGDAGRLRQIAWNLLSNATKFTPERGNIRASVGHADSAIELSVSDTGQGIDPSFLPFMFDPFRQADGSMTRPHTGLGLGLALVRQLVEAHGGTVRARSEGTGRGTTISVRLPAAPRASSDSSQKLVSAGRQVV